MKNIYGLKNLNKSYRIDGKLYDLYSNPAQDNDLVLLPRTNGDIVQNVNYSDYAYTHGGRTYRMAVEKLKEIISEMR